MTHYQHELLAFEGFSALPEGYRSAARDEYDSVLFFAGASEQRRPFVYAARSNVLDYHEWPDMEDWANPLAIY